MENIEKSILDLMYVYIWLLYIYINMAENRNYPIIFDNNLPRKIARKKQPNGILADSRGQTGGYA
jgi:hypothetical protein